MQRSVPHVILHAALLQEIDSSKLEANSRIQLPWENGGLIITVAGFERPDRLQDTYANSRVYRAQGMIDPVLSETLVLERI